MFEPEFIGLYFTNGVIDQQVFSIVFGVYFLVSFLTCLFLYLFSKIRFLFSRVSLLYFNCLATADIYRNFKLSLFFYLASVFSLLLYVGYVGGYTYLWQNIGARQDIFAGSGFFLRLVVLSLQFFGVSIFLNLITRSRILAIFFVLLTSGFLFSLGGRLSVFEFLFCIFFAYIFFVGIARIRLSYIFILVMLVVFSVFVGELRKPTTLEAMRESPVAYIEKFSGGFLKAVMPYTIPVQRDVVIVEYFSSRDFWYGASYSSVLYGFFPSALIPDKPPVDTGRYIVALANGFEITPPVPVGKLPNYGWPESFMAGYVNFGIVGVIGIVFLSCLVVVYFYKALLFRPSVVLVMIYSSLMVRGVKYLDPLNIISLTIFIIVLTILAVITSFFLRVRVYV